MADNLGVMIAIRSALQPIAAAAGAQTAVVIDAQDEANHQWDDGVLVLQSGAISGTPDEQTVDVELKHSDDGVTYEVAEDDAGNEYSKDGALDAADQVYTMRFNRAILKQYIKAVVTVNFTGGTTPKIGLSGAFVFGGAHQYPTS